VSVSTAAVTQVPIQRVVVGERRRQSLGRLQSLKKSISDHGLIHPILLRGDVLVAGHRRLEACRALNWKTIPARQVERLTDDELRAIELEENTIREALSDFAASKQRLAQIRQAEADLKAKAKEDAVSVSTRNENSKRGRREGRPKGTKAGSKRDVAEQTGISPAEQVRVERHVALAEQFPFMQRTGWVQHSVLEAGVELEKLPSRDRSQVAALLDQDAIPPKTAIGMLKNVINMNTDERRSLFEQAKSDDDVTRRTALTRAAAVPAPVDPGLTLLGDAENALRRAVKACRTAAFKPLIENLSATTTRVYTDFQEANAHARRTNSPATNGRDEASA
jgi:ParB family chromosome partitioning protein